MFSHSTCGVWHSTHYLLSIYTVTGTVLGVTEKETHAWIPGGRHHKQMCRDWIILNSDNCHDKTMGWNVIDRDAWDQHVAAFSRDPWRGHRRRQAGPCGGEWLLVAMVAAYICSCLAWTSPSIELSETARVLRILSVTCAPGQGNCITSNGYASHVVS